MRTLNRCPVIVASPCHASLLRWLPLIPHHIADCQNPGIGARHTGIQQSVELFARADKANGDLPARCGFGAPQARRQNQWRRAQNETALEKEATRGELCFRVVNDFVRIVVQGLLNR